MGDMPIGNLVTTPIVEEEKQRKVEDILNGDGNCILNKINTPIPVNKINTPIPVEILKKIRSVQLPIFQDREDFKTWSATSTGIFTCNSAYNFIANCDVNVGAESSITWRWIWKLKVRERLKYFTWLCMHRSLATNVMRKERKLSEEDVCQICLNAPETIVHTFRDCKVASEVWEHIIKPTEFLRFKGMDSENWIRENVLKSSFRNITTPTTSWSQVFLATIWSIWNARYKFVFQGRSSTTKEVVHASRTLAMELDAVFSQGKGPRNQNIRSGIRLEKPEEGWYNRRERSERKGKGSFGWIKGFSVRSRKKEWPLD